MESTGKVLVPPAGSLSPPATTTYERCVQITGSGEKPRIWWSTPIQTWACWDEGDSRCGLGDTPHEAYQDWALRKLVAEAQEMGLYGEAPATRKESP